MYIISGCSISFDFLHNCNTFLSTFNSNSLVLFCPRSVTIYFLAVAPYFLSINPILSQFQQTNSRKFGSKALDLKKMSKSKWKEIKMRIYFFHISSLLFKSSGLSRIDCPRVSRGFTLTSSSFRATGSCRKNSSNCNSTSFFSFFSSYQNQCLIHF